MVEVDGDSHFSDEAKAYDAERTAYLQSLGLLVVRFTNIDVFRQRDVVVAEIMHLSLMEMDIVLGPLPKSL